MELRDIKPGMIVVTRNKEKFLYLNGLFKRANGYGRDTDYNEDMTAKCGIWQLDIMEVYKVVNDCSLKKTFQKQNLELIWERKELPNFEHDEIIEVYCEFSDKWYKRYFKKFDENGYAICYSNGASSITVDNESCTQTWTTYRKWEKGE